MCHAPAPLLLPPLSATRPPFWNTFLTALNSPRKSPKKMLNCHQHLSNLAPRRLNILPFRYGRRRDFPPSPVAHHSREKEKWIRNQTKDHQTAASSKAYTHKKLFLFSHVWLRFYIEKKTRRVYAQASLSLSRRVRQQSLSIGNKTKKKPSGYVRWGWCN